MECKCCGKTFKPMNKTQEYCTPECRKASQSNRYFQDKAQITKRCPYCGNEYITYKTNKKYCSEQCRHDARLEIMKRYKEKNVPLYLRVRFQVFERDKFKCQYCGRGINDGVKLQIDHVIPRKQNGQNNISNYITACEDCNLGKRDVLLKANNKEEANENKI